MTNKKTTIAHLPGRKGEIDKAIQKSDGSRWVQPGDWDAPDTPLEYEHENLIQYVALLRRLIGFFQARDLIHEMPFFRLWHRPEQGRIRGRFDPQFKQIHRALDKIRNLTRRASAIEEPILQELEAFTTA